MWKGGWRKENRNAIGQVSDAFIFISPIKLGLKLRKKTKPEKNYKDFYNIIY